jgi:SAM-dependent methyltransferase
LACLICKSETGRIHHVQEMMFGTRDEFRYFECERCCCLCIMNPPVDLSAYYPSEKYYSFCDTPAVSIPQNPVRRWLKHFRDRSICLGSGGLGGWIADRYPNQDASDLRKWLKHTSVRTHKAAILDVGCGSGWHLRQLSGLGFTSLTGVDPYLPDDIQHGPIRIHASNLSVLAGRTFDLITLHHSFEHMAHQVEQLRQIREILTPDGTCMIRVPIVSRGPWQTYGTNWAEIDAPRHFVLHSEMSLKLAAEAAGLSLKCIQYESDAFTYAASELYRRGLSLHDHSANCRRQFGSVFTASELHQFQDLSKSHHVPGWAGRAAFFLTRSGCTEVYSDLSE